MTATTTADTLEQTSTTQQIALFDIDEIVLGKRLGSGGFADVYEIRAFRPNHGKRYTPDQEAARQFLTKNAKRSKSGECRFAIKFVQACWIEDKDGFEVAAADLEREADTLSTIQHPNILRIRGWATDKTHAYFTKRRHDAYFLILDRLSETLEDRIEQWKKRLETLTHSVWADVLDKNGQKKQQFLVHRLNVAYHIASALEHLHEQGVIYRDLKSTNIGFDAKGEVKIFDFGLSRQLPAVGASMDDVFEMSGRVGTPRYMAPEVSLRHAYNLKADTYSFSHLLWEVLALKRPYDGFTRKMHTSSVVKYGLRPDICPEWPVEVQALLEQSWHRDMTKRPSMKVVREVLGRTIIRLRHGDRTGLMVNTEQPSLVFEAMPVESSSKKDSDRPIKLNLFQNVRSRLFASRAA